MKWSDVGQLVSEGAPLLGALLTAPISAPVAIISLIAGAFKLSANSSPDEVYKAIKEDPEALYKLSQIQLNNHDEIERLHARLALHESDNLRHTMFKEYTIENKFKSYWRPSFGYMIVFTIPTLVIWLLFMGTWVFFVNPNQLTLLESVLTLILPPICNLLGWGIGVLGVNIFHRSKDKASLLGTENKGIISTITDTFKRK
jgi:hypothetical protein